MEQNQIVYRGEIYMADLSPVVGSEQYGVRPVVILQNDIGNRYSSTVIIAVLTKVQKKTLPTHILLSKEKYSLKYDSVALLEQLRTIDKWRIAEYVAKLDEEDERRIDEGLIVSLGLTEKVDFKISAI